MYIDEVFKLTQFSVGWEIGIYMYECYMCIVQPFIILGDCSHNLGIKE